MKKTLVLVLGLATVPAMAGDKVAPVVAPAPAPAITAPAAACPLSIEVAAVYSFANSDILRHGAGSVKDIDVYGGDLTAVYTFNKHHSVNLRFGYTFGDETNKAYNDIVDKYETDVHTFYIMPGYRFTQSLTERLSAYVGVNIGAASVNVKEHARNAGGVYSGSGSEWGFAYSAEIGLRYKLSEKCDVFAAYEFNGSTAMPDIDYAGGDTGLTTHQQSYNTVRVGVGFKF